MKVEIKKEKYRLLHPKVTFLLTTMDKKGKENVMALAWVTPLSEKPFLIGIGVGKESLSAKNIEETQEFILNIPSIKLVKAIWLCGTKSGRRFDKFRLAKLTKGKAKFLKPPYIKECIGHLECRAKKKVNAGECFFFIGEVVYAEAKKNLFKGYWRRQAELVLHLGGKTFAIPKRI